MASARCSASITAALLICAGLFASAPSSSAVRWQWPSHAHSGSAAQHLVHQQQEYSITTSRVSAVSQQFPGQQVTDGAVPGIELAARQALFDYGVQQGLQILRARVQSIAIPDVTKTFTLPVVGEFTLQLSGLTVTQFNASSDEARLSILDGKFELWVTQVEAALSFNWHWQKLGMSGSGTGELDLHGGNINYPFRIVTDQQTGKPHIMVDDTSTRFSSVEVKIKSFSADWLYQAVLSVFNDQIQKAVQNGIAGALQNDVPDSLNKVLDTLPTRLDITGLPFSTSFEYSIFTLTYVMVQGFGQVESEPKPSSVISSQSGSGSSSSQSDKAAVAATALPKQAAPRLSDIAPCPFSASPLPLTSAAIAADSHMTSIYLHKSVVNCMLWGLYNSHALQYSLTDGTIPKLHLTTDLLAMLIPQLPKQYPHQLLRIEAQALSVPSISFQAEAGTVIQASYQTSIFVMNETAGNPKIATMAANLTVNAQVGYDYTIISSVTVHHDVVESVMPVSAPTWDNTVAWAVQNYAGLFPLQTIINTFIHTPVTSLVAMVNAQTKTLEGWFALSGDVQLRL